MSHINSGYIGVDKRSSKGGVYGLRKHRQERSLGNFKSVIHEQIAGGKSLRFDGTDDFAQTSSVSLVAKTISIWIKPDSTINASSSRQCLLGFGESEEGIYLGGENSQLTDEVIQITDGYGSWGYESGSASLLSSGWHHICCVWETSSSSTNSGNPGYDIYLNGAKVGNGFGNFGLYGNRNHITTSTVKQGAFARTSGGTPCFYDGLQDEVAIWNVSLSAADITSIYNAGAPNDLTESASYDTDRTGGLIGYWRNGDGTENGSGTTIHDMSSNSNNMTLTNGPTYSDSVPTFASTVSADLDGTNDYLAVGSSYDLGTLSMWFKSDSVISASSAVKNIVGFTGVSPYGTYGGISFGPVSSAVTNEIISIYTGDWVYSYAHASSTIATGWHHLAVRWTGSDYEIYLDGVQVKNEDGEFDPQGTAKSKIAISAFNIGRRNSDRYFDGLIDEVAIWSTPLSASDTAALYNSGAPSNLSALSPNGWWRMGENDSGSNGATIGTVTDQGSGGNNATGTNGPTYSDTVPS